MGKKKKKIRERRRKGKKGKRGKKVKKKTISDRGYSLFLTIAFTEREGPNTFSRSGRPIFQTARHSERIDEVRAPAKQPFRPWGRLASWDVGLLAVRGALEEVRETEGGREVWLAHRRGMRVCRVAARRPSCCLCKLGLHTRVYSPVPPSSESYWRT